MLACWRDEKISEVRPNTRLMRLNHLAVELDHDSWAVDTGNRACFPAVTVSVKPDLVVDRHRFD